MKFNRANKKHGSVFRFGLRSFLRAINRNRNKFVSMSNLAKGKNRDPKKMLELIKRNIESLKKAIENLTKQIKDIKKKISILEKNPKKAKGTELEELKKQLKELEEQRKSYRKERIDLEEKHREIEYIANKIAGRTGTGVRGVPTKAIEERVKDDWKKQKSRDDEAVTTDISNGNMNFKSREGRAVYVMNDNELRSIHDVDGSPHTGHMTESELVADKESCDKESWRNKIAEAKDLAYKHNLFIKDSGFGRGGRQQNKDR